MAAVFSKSCQYAIQAVLYLARATHGNESVHVKQISDALEIPHHFLGKVLQMLSRHGIVTSQKGVNGGFQLARHPKEITVIDVVNAIDGRTFFNECIFGFPGCGDTLPCSIHEIWKGPKESIFEMLRQQSIADLCIEVGRKGMLISSPDPSLTQLQ